MRIFDKYRADIYSQTGEDGLLEEIIRRLQPKEKTCCEFGAADGKYCSNTFYLIERGWKGKMMEADPNRLKSLIDNTMPHGVAIYCGNVTPENVNDRVPQQLTLLSIDIDNNDYHCWKAYRGVADIVVIEINSSVAPGVEMIPGERGSSYTSMVKLGIDKGYFIVAHRGNCIFVLNKYRHLFPEVEQDGLVNANDYFDRSWL